MRRSLLVATLLLAAMPAHAVRYSNRSLHYSFELPPGWVEIPKSVLDRGSEFLGTAAGVKRPSYVAGFQKSGKPWFSLPYVLVLDHPGRGVTFGEVAEMYRKLAKMGPSIMKNKLVTNPALGQLIVDASTHSIYMPSKAELPGVGPTKGVMIVRLGRSGLLQINFYAADADFGTSWTAFRQSVRSLRFEDGYDYSLTSVVLAKLDRPLPILALMLVLGAVQIMLKRHSKANFTSAGDSAAAGGENLEVVRECEECGRGISEQGTRWLKRRALCDQCFSKAIG